MDFNTPFDFAASANSREASDVRFMYFSSKEVRNISVVQIDDVALFDEWNEQVEGGLYAPQMGPMKMNKEKRGEKTFCKTCGLTMDCPGHMGHIEFATPVFNPFLMGSVQKLMARCCMKCKKLLCTDAKTQNTVVQLQRLAPGDMAKTRGSKQKGARKRTALESDLKGDEDEFRPKRLMVHEINKERGDRIYEAQPMTGMSSYLQHEMAGDILYKEAEQIDARREQDEMERRARASSSSASGTGQRCHIAACTQSLRAVLGEYCRDIPARCARCEGSGAKVTRLGFTALKLTRLKSEWKRDGGPEDGMLLPMTARTFLRELWENERDILWYLIPGARELEAEMYFLDNILVPPNRFRPAEPPLMEGGAPRLDRQTSHFLNVVFANHEVRRLIKKNSKKQQGDDEEASEEDDEEAEENKKKAKAAEKPQKGKGRGKGAAEKSSVRKMDSLEQAVEQLQTMVNSCMDSGKSGKHPKLAVPGVRQLLERKEGLFRMKMMGKRVNFAARSVISPDPNIETSEIGIPMMIAEELTYPEVAADHNIDLLRRLVERGAEYPGATEVHVPKASGGKVITKLRFLDPQRRMAIAKQLQMDMESGKPPMTVFRQLVDGDPLLVNRQPTLHKPGIMAHVAKVMRKEKTIRLHYVNCNTYNADFDGDEMNLHAPQDPIGRMEALGIARADKQYLVPTSGKPLRGLIQDHCIAGAMLSKRDSFFTRADVCFLLYTGLRAAVETGISTFDFGNKKKNKSSTRPFVYPSLQSYTQHLRLRLDEPTILKPRKLWSGKQVFTMLLKNLVELCGERKAPVGLYLESNSKTPGDIWNGKLDGDKEESSVLFQDMDFLRGVLDKAQFGASSYGLTHIIHELLGGNLVGMWFASLARMLTMLLQMRGFTCAFADLLLTDQTEETRRKLIKTSRVSAKGAVEGWLTKNEVPGFADGKATPHRISEAASDLLPKQKRAQEYEGAVIGKMKENWSDLINMCIPVGQKLTFPRNCFSAMVQTGAKGSKVNQSQVSCCLGQQELEGRLPPLMCTYRSLPCFAAFDMASRTRGYIADRFLSGIRPQEFFFHCMAGREGLVDTAVKTSRSGYLQRCLIKHLEGLKVSYDLTVRDSDGSVLQFLYGEDGADVTRASYLFNFKALQPNLKAVQANMEEYERTFCTVESRASPAFLAVRQACSQGKAKEAARLLKQMLNECPELDPASRHYLQTKLEDLRRGVIPDHIDPQSSILSPAHHFGSTSEKHEGELKKYIDGLRAKGAISEADAAALTKCMKIRFMQALAEPGEAVGVIAAQSMGEPSTQMTLNTFHLAGHGGANVTLGIPRLREIVQTASKTCSTPLMSVKVLCDETGNTSHDARMAYAQKMQSKFRHIKFMDCVQRLVVHEECKEQKNGEVWWVYHCRFFFFDINQIHKKVPHITAQRLQSFMTRCIVRKLKNQITRVMNAAKAAAAAHKQSKAGDEGEQVGLGDDAGGEAAGGSKDSKVAPKKKARYMARGAEDREGIEEANVNADEAEAENADGPDNGDDESEASGMYEDKDDEDIAFEGNADPEEAVADPAEDEAGEAAPRGRPDGGEAMGVGKPKGKAKAASSKPGSSSRPPAPAEEDSEEEDEEEDVAEAGDDESFVDSDEDSSDESSNEDAPEGGKGMAGEKRKKGTKQVDTNAGLRDSRAQQDLEAAWESSAMAYSGPLENDEMCVVVRHRHSECPHSVYVGEVLHKLCSRGQLQDPSCKGVKKVHVKQERGEVFLECEGINLYSLQLLGDTVDHRGVYTNDIQRVLRKFGVEAARAAVVREIRNVFGHYGIDVDHRHLSLIADYMGQAGGLRAFNRGGMTQSASPIQQMSFETTMQFMTAACQDGLPDSVDSPASSIVLGQLPKVGTGMVEVLVDLTPKDPKWRKRREFTFDG